MNSGPTSERVYDALRRRILELSFAPGQRLDPARLATDLLSSITPVRDALHILAGRGLVATGTSEGFHIPHMDEPAIRDLYAWNLEVLSLAIRSWPRKGVPAPTEASRDAQGDPASVFADISVGIAKRSANAEHLREVASLNDRLHPLRVAEERVLDHVGSEGEALGQAFADLDQPRLRRLLLAYHRRRQRHAAGIVRACYRR